MLPEPGWAAKVDGPAADAEIRRAGAEGKGVLVIPISFVSEHSETLVELDMEYGKLAREAGVRDYLRVPTVSTRPSAISASEWSLPSLTAASSGSIND